MDKKSILIWGILVLVALAFLVYARDVIPQGDFNGMNTFSIKNFTNINGTNVYLSGNLSLGNQKIKEYWNGSCFNTEVNGVLVQSIGCS